MRSTIARGVFLRAIAAAGCVALWLVPPARCCGAEPAVSFGREFLRAIRLFEDDDPRKREEGQKLLRELGGRALADLERWIARAAVNLERVRALHEHLGGEGSGEDDAIAAARPFFARKVEEAWARHRDGRYVEAKQLADAVIRLDPESPDTWRLRRLIRLCEDRLIQREILEPIVELQELVYGFGEEPLILFRLVNRSRSVVTMRVDDRGVLGHLQISRRRSFIDGSTRDDEDSIAIRVAGEERTLRLEPGASYDRKISVGVMEAGTRGGVVARVRVVGKFQPAQWGVEDRNLTRTLNLPPAECWVVDAAEKTLAEAPLKKLQASILVRDLRAFFVGGQLAVWAAENDPSLNERIQKTLIEALDDLDDTGLSVADHLLRQSTGAAAGPQGTGAVRERWKSWWQERLLQGVQGSSAPPSIPRVLRKDS